MVSVRLEFNGLGILTSRRPFIGLGQEDIPGGKAGFLLLPEGSRLRSSLYSSYKRGFTSYLGPGPGASVSWIWVTRR
jgi:hypothetical protein